MILIRCENDFKSRRNSLLVKQFHKLERSAHLKIIWFQLHDRYTTMTNSQLSPGNIVASFLCSACQDDSFRRESAMTYRSLDSRSSNSGKLHSSPAAAGAMRFDGEGKGTLLAMSIHSKFCSASTFLNIYLTAVVCSVRAYLTLTEVLRVISQPETSPWQKKCRRSQQVLSHFMRFFFVHVAQRVVRMEIILSFSHLTRNR